tara:strand:+ start:553 stop:1911 length:1359 start_codon:yes stop_codon:yes gene_type:complete
MVAILGANSVSGEYEVSNSLRFNDNDSPYLSRTPSSASNRTTWTWSAWIKRSAISTSNYQTMWNAGSSSSDDIRLSITNNDQIIFGTDATNFFITSQRLRDVSAWYHIVLAFDTTQGTASDRAKLYINGSLVSDFSTDNRSSLSGSYAYNNTVGHALGRQATGGSAHYDGYMTEINFIDGQQLAQTQFGEFDDNGVWIPKEYTGTYGTNGFFLEFKQTGTSQNSSGIGADTSGNDNHFAVNNFTATDVNVDTCTNNWCTLNPLDTPSGSTFSEGNQKISSSTSQQGYTRSTFAVSQGKWYFEAKITTSSVREAIGVVLVNTALTDNTVKVDYYSRYGHVLKGNSLISTQATYGNNDRIGVAFNLDDNTVAFYKNGSLQDTVTSIDSGTYSPMYRDGSDAYACGAVFNFGNNGTFSGLDTAQGNSDANSYGDFYYSVPSGYYALNTKNLSEFG